MLNKVSLSLCSRFFQKHLLSVDEERNAALPARWHGMARQKCSSKWRVLIPPPEPVPSECPSEGMTGGKGQFWAKGKTQQSQDTCGKVAWQDGLIYSFLPQESRESCWGVPAKEPRGVGWEQSAAMLLLFARVPGTTE